MNKKALGETETAMSFYKEAVKSYQKQKDSEGSKKYINCLRKQAKCCSKLKKFQEAHSVLNTALKATHEDQHLQGDLELLSVLYDDLAAVCTQLGDQKNFSKYANTALKLKYEHYGPDHLHTALAMISAG